MNFSSQSPFFSVTCTSSTSNTTCQSQAQKLPIPTIPTTANMGVVHNSQQQQLFLQNLAALLQPQLTNQFITQAQILFQQQFAAAAAPVPKTPITKPFSARAFSSPNSIISASAPVRKLRDSLYQGMLCC